MKKILIVLLVIILGLLPVNLSQAATGENNMSVVTGINYDSWWDDQSPENSGYEFLLPVKVSYRQKTYSADLITAYAKADYDGIDNSSISCLTDTSVKLKYTVPDLPVSLLLGMDFNIPTGKEKLASDEVKAEMDEDLVRLNNFGEGLNIGPSASIAKQFGKIFVGVGTGYIWKGEYDPTDYQENDDTDPGDEIIISGNVIYLYSDSLELNGKLTYFWYDVNEVNGADYFQIGETYQIGGGLKYKLDPYIIYASFLEILQDKNKEVNLNGVFGSEENNSNGDIFQLNFGLDYPYTTKLKLKGILETKFIDSNGYDANSDYYDAGRTKYAFGPGAEYKINQNCTVNGFLKYFILEDDKDASVAQDTTYQGIDFSVEVSYNF